MAKQSMSTCCAMCDRRIVNGDLVHDLYYIAADRSTHAQVVCERCAGRVRATPKLMAAVRDRMSLRFEPARGNA